MTANEVISIARAQIGKPYVFGAAGPNSFDCSGLVLYAFKRGANKNLPHYTGTLISYGTSVRKADLAPGDLVFPDSHHVQIYSGNGMIIEAPHTGANVREVKMWGFWQARRIIAPGTGTVSTTPNPGNGAIVPVGNPLVPDSIENAAKFLSDPAVYRKAGMVVGGVICVLVGVLMMTGQVTGVSSVVKAVAK